MLSCGAVQAQADGSLMLDLKVQLLAFLALPGCF